MTKEELIPSTPELNRLKEYLATIACGREVPPYTKEELMNTPLTGVNTLRWYPSFRDNRWIQR